MGPFEGGSGIMSEEVVGTEAVLATVLLRAREEYQVLEGQELLGVSPDEREIYFRHSALLRQLIGSIESFLDEKQRLNQLRETLRNRKLSLEASPSKNI
jgi:PhoPQ-activated pathogenicity-related protein